MRSRGALVALALSALTVGCTVLTVGCIKGCRTRQAAPAAAPAEVKEAEPAAPPRQDALFAPPAREALRRRDYASAARLLDASPEHEQREPEHRLARARAALELGELDRALSKLDRLAEDAPEFAPEVAALRLEVAARSDDVTLVASLLGAGGSGSAESLLRQKLVLAAAHERAGSLEEGVALADQVLGALARKAKPSRGEEELELRARALRAGLLERFGRSAAAAAEQRWLATRAPLAEEATRADERAEQLDPKSPLGANERFARAKTFSDAGLLERTLRELALLDAAPGAKPSRAERDTVEAFAAYNGRADYERAARLFASAAAAAGTDRKKLLYYEARALSRAGRDAEAIERYDRLARLGGPFGDSAAYQAARLRVLEGQLKQAIAGFDVYLAKRAGGQHQEAATYELSVALLAAGDFARARKSLAAQVAREEDERERGRLLELEGVAAEGQGRLVEAEALYRKVIRERALTFPALLAEARLLALGLQPPQRLEPAPTRASAAPLALELPDKVRRLARVGLDEEAEAALRASEGALRARYAEQGDEALCRLYGELNAGMRRYQVAQTAASGAALMREPAGDGAWQWDCIYPRPYQSEVERAATEAGVAPALIWAVMRQESAFRPLVVSPAQAVGLLQLIPPTAARVAEELGEPYRPEALRVPSVNVRYGARYLRRLLGELGERPELAVAAYNAGPRAVVSWLRAGEALPLDVFLARIPYEETRTYVQRVMGNYYRYALLLGEHPPAPDLALPRGLRAAKDAY